MWKETRGDKVMKLDDYIMDVYTVLTAILLVLILFIGTFIVLAE